jgi:MFS family permease
MVSSIVYGIFLERYSKFMVMTVMFSLGCIGSFLFCFITSGMSPLNGIAFTSMVILGLGMGGLLTSALFLINKYAVVNHRGYISGLANFFSVVGIACISAVGYVVNKKNKKIFFYIKKLFELIS